MRNKSLIFHDPINSPSMRNVYQKNRSEEHPLHCSGIRYVILDVCVCMCEQSNSPAHGSCIIAVESNPRTTHTKKSNRIEYPFDSNVYQYGWWLKYHRIEEDARAITHTKTQTMANRFHFPRCVYAFRCAVRAFGRATRSTWCVDLFFFVSSAGGLFSEYNTLSGRNKLTRFQCVWHTRIVVRVCVCYPDASRIDLDWVVRTLCVCACVCIYKFKFTLRPTGTCIIIARRLCGSAASSHSLRVPHISASGWDKWMEMNALINVCAWDAMNGFGLRDGRFVDILCVNGFRWNGK